MLGRISGCAVLSTYVAEAETRCRRGSTATTSRRPAAWNGRRSVACDEQVKTTLLSYRCLRNRFVLRREDLINKSRRNVHDEYDIKSTIGEGAFANVMLAKHRRTGATRALKQMCKLDHGLECFDAEVHALISLEHPHIVKAIEYFDEDTDAVYIVLEHLEGDDLFVLLESHVKADTHLEERDIAVTMRQCIKAVVGCHERGFLHRDLKPENFMFTGSDQVVKLIDLGFAQPFMRDDSVLDYVGSLEYMAPEVLAGLDGDKRDRMERTRTGKLQRPSEALDVWSLGVMLFVMFGLDPFLTGSDEKKRADLQNRTFREERLKSLGAYREQDISPEARDLIAQMLQHDPATRISLQEALQHPFLAAASRDNRPFDNNLVDKMRRFAAAPRFQKLCFFAMTHFFSVSVAPEELGALLEARRHFRNLDDNGDGRISLEDIELALKNEGLDVPADMEIIFTLCDCSCSGTLQLTDFAACLLAGTFENDAHCRYVFNFLDKNANDRIDVADMMVRFGMRKSTAEEMINEVVDGEKNYLEFRDFRRLAMQR